MSEINQKDLISEILLFCRSNLVQLEYKSALDKSDLDYGFVIALNII